MLRHPDRAGSRAHGLGSLLGRQAHHNPQDENFALLA
jgi:hypothetical protein